jgi:hypothetical protein
MAGAIKEPIEQNQASLRQYTWTAHTEISLKGEVKNQKDESYKYGPNGKVVKALIGEPPPEKQMGRAKKRVVEKKVGEMKEYMERARALAGMFGGEKHEVFTDRVADVDSSISFRERPAERISHDGQGRPKGD